ncbi:phage portal protein [Stenotrophomonas maltophilia]|uniref:phage portal protein n=1 Tax=Stenotrophomonas maltophilia TaxID=40324 RepID=UPI000C14C121|nr:phage portal protein [Stenotrophomonas maltophilia]
MFGLFEKNRRADTRDRIEPTISNLVDGEVIQSSGMGMFEVFGNPTTASGAVVSPESAMRVSAVFAAVSLLAGAIAQLPLPVFERADGHRKRAEHDYWWLLNEQFSSGWSSATGWEFIVGQMLLRGDGVVYVTRNRAGVATGLIPWPRDRVMILKQEKTSPREPTRLQYTFHDADGYFTVDQDDVLHFPGFGFNGVHGMSVIQWGARNGIGIAIQGDEHAGKFFSEGGKPEVAIRTPNKMTKEQQDDFRDAWVKKYGGVQGNRRIPLVLTEGLEVHELTMSAVDQQLLESRQWQVIDVARAFGVPPHMIGETTKSTSWGSGIESMGIGFVKYTLGPHLKRIKDELNRKLFRTPRYFVEHNVDMFMAGDSKTQAEYFSKALGGPGTQGWMVVNEVRRLKNLPPIEGGDKLYQPKEPAPPAKPDSDDPERNPDDADS